MDGSLIHDPRQVDLEDYTHGPTVMLSRELHASKYRDPDETFEQAMERIASRLADSANHYDHLLDILLDMRFLPAGRVQNAIGAKRDVTALNCFVSGTIADAFTGPGSIMERASEAAETMRMGGGIGYDFSTLRPRGDIIRKLNSRSSGPVAFMDIFNAVCGTVSSAGHRRGAQMGVLRVDHPDIEQFIAAKTQPGVLTRFNVSVAVTDAFMEAMLLGKPFELKFGGQVYKTVDAQELWERIMRTTWDWAEPGVLFIDRINEMNNLYYCETIAATNPCGEQPLPPYGCCLLGSFNLTKYVSSREGRFVFDLNKLESDIPVVVRAMDNVVDATSYPLPQQEKEQKSKRRMGLGVTGLANCAEALHFPYGSKRFLDFERSILRRLRDGCYHASALLAQAKGSFPKFDRERYLTGKFAKTLMPEVREMIGHMGLRNSHLLSIAPTGTISLCADNVSSGLEPVFAYSFERTVQEFDGPRVETVYDYGFRKLGVRGRRAADVTADWHIDVLCVAAQHVDSAVSKTCNVSPNMPWDEFKNLYRAAWEGGAKGVTTFNPGGKRAGILVANEDAEEDTKDAAPSCSIDPETGRRSCE